MNTGFSIYDLEEDDPLQKQFKTLELEWDSIKQLISRSNRRSSTIVAADRNIFHPYTDSPKELMALLQNECSPNLVHQDEAAAVDFDDSVLIGRRLFEEPESGSDDYNGYDGVCFDVDVKSEVGMEFLVKGFGEYDASNSGQCNGVLTGRGLFEKSEDNDVIHGLCFDADEKSEVSTEFLVKGFEEHDGKCDRLGGFSGSCMDVSRCDVAERGGSEVAVKSGSGGSVGRWFVSVVIVLFALVIVAFECRSEDQDILVPT